MVGRAILGLAVGVAVAAAPAAPRSPAPVRPDAPSVPPGEEEAADFPGGDPLVLGLVMETVPGVAVADVRVNDASDIGEPAGCSIQSEVSVAGFGDRVYVAYNDLGECLEPPGRTSAFGFAVSADRGRTFEETGPILPTGGLRLSGDPVVVVDTTGDRAGHVYLASMADRANGTSTIAVARSTDGGTSFTWVDAAPAGHSGFTQDKQWLAIDDTGGPRDGSLYLVWVDFGGGQDILFTASTDGGLTWSPPKRLGFQGRGPRVAVGPDGEVHAVWHGYEDGAPAILWSRSLTGGATFSLARIAVRTTRTGGTRCGQQALNGDIRTQEFPSIAVDGHGSSDPSTPDHNPLRGTVYVAYAGSRPGDESDVFLSRLLPGATAWTAGLRVNDDATATDQFFPEVAVTGPGRVAVAWTDRREDAGPDGNLLMRQYLATSEDGGASFGPSVPFSDVAYPPPYSDRQPVKRVAACYAGDYNALVSDRPGHLLAGWSDNRDGIKVTAAGGIVIPDPNVFFRQADV